MTVDLYADLKKLSPKPGDVIHVRVENISMENIDQITRGLREVLPEGVRSIITDETIEIDVAPDGLVSAWLPKPAQVNINPRGICRNCGEPQL